MFLLTLKHTLSLGDCHSKAFIIGVLALVEFKESPTKHPEDTGNCLIVECFLLTSREAAVDGHYCPTLFAIYITSAAAVRNGGDGGFCLAANQPN